MDTKDYYLSSDNESYHNDSEQSDCEFENNEFEQKQIEPKQRFFDQFTEKYRCVRLNKDIQRKYQHQQLDPKLELLQYNETNYQQSLKLPDSLTKFKILIHNIVQYHIQNNEYPIPNVIRVDNKQYKWQEIKVVVNSHHIKNTIQSFKSNQSFHQIITSSADITPFFDIDFKSVCNMPSIQQIKKDFEHSIKKVICDYIGNDVTNKYELIDQTNTTKLGFHVHLKGIKTNLSIVKFLAYKVNEEMQKINHNYLNLVDTQPYKLGGTIRWVGSKFTDEGVKTNDYIPNSKTQYCLLYQYDAVFVSLNGDGIKLYYQLFGKEQQEHEEYEVNDALFNNTIKPSVINYFESNKIAFSPTFTHDSKNYRVQHLEIQCPICKRNHSQTINNYLRIILKKDLSNIVVKCFQNKWVNNEYENKNIVIPLNQKGVRFDLVQYILKSDLQISQKLLDFMKQSNSWSQQNIWDSIKDNYEKFNDPAQYKDVTMGQEDIESNLNQLKDVYIYSQIGTGKSKLIEKFVKTALDMDYAIVHLTHRITSTHNKSKIYGATTYLEKKGICYLDKKAHYMFQLEAINRLKICFGVKLLVIIDESVSQQIHMHSSEYMDDSYDSLHTLLKEASNIIIADGMLNKERIVPLMDLYREYNTGYLEREYTWIEHNVRPLLYRNKTKVNIQIGFDKQNELQQKLLDIVLFNKQQGSKTAIVMSRKYFGYQLLKQLKDNQLRCLYINGDNDFIDNWNDETNQQLHKEVKQQMMENLDSFNQYDVVIYTQTLSCGISFENHSDFKSLIAVIDQQTMGGSYDVVQSLFRFRNIQNIQMFVSGYRSIPNIDSLQKAELYYSKLTKQINVQPIDFSFKTNKLRIFNFFEYCIQNKRFLNLIIEYLLKLGASIQKIEVCGLEENGEDEEDTSKNTFINHQILSTSEQFKFMPIQMTVNDLFNFLVRCNQQPVNKEEYYQKRQTLIKIFEMKLFKPSIRFDTQDIDNTVNQEYTDLFNDHLQEYYQAYNEINKSVDKEVKMILWQSIKTPNQKMSTNIQQIIEMQKQQVDMGNVQTLVKLSKLLELSLVIENRQFEKLPELFNKRVKDSYKYRSEKLDFNIKQWIERSLPYSLIYAGYKYVYNTQTKQAELNNKLEPIEINSKKQNDINWKSIMFSSNSDLTQIQEVSVVSGFEPFIESQPSREVSKLVKQHADRQLNKKKC